MRGRFPGLGARRCARCRVAEPAWTVEVYETVQGRCPYERFLDGLDAVSAAALIAAVEHVLARNGIELARSEWLKALGEGLFEFRIRHDADEITAMFTAADPAALAALALPAGPVLLRVFCTFYGNKVVLLLGGYDKGADDSAKRQQREIKAARKLLTEWQQEQHRAKAADRKNKR